MLKKVIQVILSKSVRFIQCSQSTSQLQFYVGYHKTMLEKLHKTSYVSSFLLLFSLILCFKVLSFIFHLFYLFLFYQVYSLSWVCNYAPCSGNPILASFVIFIYLFILFHMPMLCMLLHIILCAYLPTNPQWE